MLSLPFSSDERARSAVDDHRHLAFGVPRRRQRPRLVLVLRNAGREALDPDLRSGIAARLRAPRTTAPSCPPDRRRTRHRRRRARPSARAAHRAFARSMRPCRSSMSCASRDSTWTRLKRVEVAVLERRELLLEHHGARRAVAVEQRELASRLGGERRLDDRQQRRDAAARREADVVSAALRVERNVEVPHRRHHVERRRPPSASRSPTSRTRRPGCA